MLAANSALGIATLARDLHTAGVRQRTYPASARWVEAAIDGAFSQSLRNPASQIGQAAQAEEQVRQCVEALADQGATSGTEMLVGSCRSFWLAITAIIGASPSALPIQRSQDIRERRHFAADNREQEQIEEGSAIKVGEPKGTIRDRLKIQLSRIKVRVPLRTAPFVRERSVAMWPTGRSDRLYSRQTLSRTGFHRA